MKEFLKAELCNIMEELANIIDKLEDCYHEEEFKLPDYYSPV